MSHDSRNQHGLSGGDSPSDAESQIQDEDSRQIGPYRLLEVLGEGGFGVVFLAEQSEPVRRNVALKIIKPGMDTKQVVARFEAERQALAVMDHPNIAKVHDGGATEAGRPYFVMELVRGVPISEYCDMHKLTINDRALLFIDVCQAVQHAHQKGVIHRDLKPSNILVTDQDGKPVPKVIDFGIAKAIGYRLTEKSLHTQRGHMIGTPAYMSPEQAEMSGLDVDTRTDIYSLGVILYELLTGVLPFRQKELQGLAALLTLREKEPPTPSTRFSTLGARQQRLAELRATDPRSLKRNLTGDLDWITMKAMEKNRARRYETANGLALEMRRYLNGEPVLARAPSTGYRVGKFVGRHTAGVAFSTLLVLVLVGFAITMSVQAARIAEERDRANQEAATAQQVSDFMVDLFNVADPSEARGNTITAREILDKGAEEIEQGLQDQPEVQGRLLDVIGRVYMSLGLYKDAEPLLEEAVRVRRAALGDEHPELAVSLRRIAYFLNSIGNAKEALPLAEQALGINQKTLGVDHQRTAGSHVLVGRVYRSLGEYDEARKHLEQALTIQERVLGADHRETASTLSNLGWLHKLLGEFETAKAYYERAILNAEKVLEPDHPGLASYLSDLGVVYSDLGDDSAARHHYQQALAIREKTLGPDHTAVADVLNNLGILEWQAGNLAEARRYYERSLEIREKAIGPESPAVAGTLNNLALLLQRSGEYAEALTRYERALAIKEKTLGPDHVDVASSLSNLGYLLRYIGNYTRARPLLERALAIQEKVTGPNHLDLVYPLMNLGFLFSEVGEYERARESFGRALSIGEKVYGQDHTQVLGQLFNLSRVLIHMGDYDAAQPLLERVLSIQGANQLESSTVFGLAKVHYYRGDAAKGDSLFARSLEITADSQGRQSASFAYVQASYWTIMGDREKALHYLRTALDRGYSDPWLYRDPDLATLHGDARFEAMVAEVKKRAGIEDLVP